MMEREEQEPEPSYFNLTSHQPRISFPFEHMVILILKAKTKLNDSKMNKEIIIIGGVVIVIIIIINNDLYNLREIPRNLPGGNRV